MGEDISTSQAVKFIFLSFILIILIFSIMITLIKCAGCKIERDDKIMVQQKKSRESVDREKGIV